MICELWFSIALNALTAQDPEPPASLADLVMGCRHRPVVERRLDGVDFHAVERRPGQAFILWLAEGEAPPFAYDREEARAFLQRCSTALGFDGFVLRDAGTRAWREDEVWDFELLRGKVPIFDARIEVHWRGGVLVGLVADGPLPIGAVDAVVPVGPNRELTLYPVQEDGAFSLRLAEVRRTRTGDRRRTEVISLSGGARMHIGLTPAVWVGTREDVMIRFDETIVPVGSFPDQIDLDSRGRVWFSQPLDDYLTRFDPIQKTFTRFPTGESGPDGMDVDSEDHVWSGLYYSGRLARYNPITGNVRRFAMPYSPSAPAIPTETLHRTVWVTDHQYNKVSEFHRDTRSWVRSLDMPTPGSWVVEGDLHPGTGDVYFSCYGVDRLAVVTPAGVLTDFPVTPGGPAFPVVSGNRVFYSLWNRDRLGVYDITTGTTTEWAFPIAGEVGGPIARTPDGRIVVGTRNLGYIMVFDPRDESIDAYDIPTPGPGLKDGLTVAPNGTVWFTETGANKIARLRIR